MRKVGNGQKMGGGGDINNYEGDYLVASRPPNAPPTSTPLHMGIASINDIWLQPYPLFGNF